MLELLTPLKSESLVEVFIRRFEELIISGKISIGEKLPSERELALQLGVSRPVVHEGLVELESKGLVTIKPRAGATVNDYRREGSPALLESLIRYSSGKIRPEIFDSILRMRVLFETETAAMAAVNRTDENLAEFEQIIADEKNSHPSDIETQVRLDFSFHLLVAIASGNHAYPLLLNSFKDLYTNLTRGFFKVEGVADYVFKNHEKLYKTIKAGDKKSAVKIMSALIEHGERHLKNSLSESGPKQLPV